ncbi:MAG: thioredoxin domain-containing protein, partial [Pseudomonadota bacterium]|nr:thioredoxin domain-containing protein [Pseudomonadota bacterium]
NHDVKYIIKEFPILGSQSLLAAQALLSVLLKHPNEVYKTFSDSLMNHKGTITKDILKSFAQKAGAEVSDLESTMNSQEINDMIAKNASLAETLQIRGTPTFILGNQIIRGFISKSDLQELIEIARKQL